MYNRVALKDFLDAGGFVGFPGIKVSKRGGMFLTKENKSGPLMIDADAGDIVIRGCYRKSQGEGVRLLTVLPEVFNTSVEKLFHKWVSGAQIDVSDAKLIVPTKGNTYINYKHELNESLFPAEASAFGIIPSFYCIDDRSSGNAKLVGVAFRVCPTHLLTVTHVPSSGLDYVPDTAVLREDDDFVATSSESAPQVKTDSKRKRSEVLTALPFSRKK